MIDYLFVFLYFLPAFVANAMPVIVKNIPGLRTWNTPVCESMFGKNKTYRGFVFGLLGAVIIGYILYYKIYFLGFPFLPYIMTSFLMGLGALVGDLVESFIKRRLYIKPGKPLPFWDGVDYILGAMLFTLPFFVPTLDQFLFLLLIAPILSLVSNSISYLLGWKNVWY